MDTGCAGDPLNCSRELRSVHSGVEMELATAAPEDPVSLSWDPGLQTLRWSTDAVKVTLLYQIRGHNFQGQGYIAVGQGYIASHSGRREVIPCAGGYSELLSELLSQKELGLVTDG